MASDASSSMTRTIAVAAAGIAAVVGVVTLQKHRGGRASAAPVKSAKSAYSVALLRLRVPRDWRDQVATDVFLEKAVSAAGTLLIIFVVGRGRHAVVNYASQLYNLTWDVVSLKAKYDLDVRIIAGTSDKGVPTWDDLVRLPELDVVLDADESTTSESLNASRQGLRDVAFQPLAPLAKPYFRDDMYYFENDKTSLEGHSIVMVGGTFDHLHNGHKKLLSLATSISNERLIVGITSEEMLRKKKNAELIDSLEKREENVRTYVAFLKPALRVEFALLTDAFGPSIVIDDADACLVVSTETVGAVPIIQEKRAAKHLPPLKIFVCRRTDASTLSSSFIRDQLAADRQS